MEVHMLRKIFYIASGLLISVTLLGSMGLGAWNYNLNNKLEKSQADYATLESDYNKLDAEYDQAKADNESKLEKSQAELDEAQAQIKKLEQDLDQSRSENKALESKISAIQSKVSVLYAFWFTSDSAFAQQVENSDDEQLQKLYRSLNESQSWDAFVEFMSYLIESVSETSGFRWQPTVNAVQLGHAS